MTALLVTLLIGGVVLAVNYWPVWFPHSTASTDEPIEPHKDDPRWDVEA